MFIAWFIGRNILFVLEHLMIKMKRTIVLLNGACPRIEFISGVLALTLLATRQFLETKNPFIVVDRVLLDFGLEHVSSIKGNYRIE